MRSVPQMEWRFKLYAIIVVQTRTIPILFCRESKRTAYTASRSYHRSGVLDFVKIMLENLRSPLKKIVSHSQLLPVRLHSSANTVTVASALATTIASHRRAGISGYLFVGAAILRLCGFRLLTAVPGRRRLAGGELLRSFLDSNARPYRRTGLVVRRHLISPCTRLSSDMWTLVGLINALLAMLHVFVTPYARRSGNGSGFNKRYSNAFRS